MKILPLVEQHYQEIKPQDMRSIKESESRAEATLARVEKLKAKAKEDGHEDFLALLEGRILASKWNSPEVEKLFSQPYIAKKEGLPRLKLSEAIASGDERRSKIATSPSNIFRNWLDSITTKKL